MKVSHIAQKRKRLQALISRKGVVQTISIVWKTGWLGDPYRMSEARALLSSDIAHAVESLMEEEDEIWFQEALQSLDNQPSE